jgi:serine protease Do
MSRFQHTTASPRRSLVLRVFLLATLAAMLAAPLAMARDRAFLGITSRSLTGRDARNLELDRRDGALIQTVYDDTAADKAGLRKNDVIIEFDGEKVFDDDDLGDMIRDHDAGDKVEIVILRDGKQKTLDATLGSNDDWTEGQFRFTAPSVAVGSFFSQDRRPQLGVNVMDLNSQLAEYFNVSDERGVLVTRVVRRSPADEAGIQAGDVIVRAGGERVVQTGDISNALEGRWGERIQVEVVRNGSRREIAVSLDDEDDD